MHLSEQNEPEALAPPLLLPKDDGVNRGKLKGTHVVKAMLAKQIDIGSGG